MPTPSTPIAGEQSVAPAEDAPPPPAAFGAIPFRDGTIRFARIDTLPYYAASDVCAALQLPLAETLERDVAEVHKRLALIEASDGFETQPVLSPIGAWTLSLYLGFGCALKEAFQRWVFKETKRLQPDAFDRERYGAAQCMALRPNGDVPPAPSRRSGRSWEWDDLRDSNAHFAFRYPANSRRSPIQIALDEREEDEREMQMLFVNHPFLLEGLPSFVEF